MNSEWKDSAQRDEAIVKIEGTPKTADGATLSRRELISFQAVALLLGTKIKEGAGLAEEFVRAKVAQETNTAKRIAEEASNLAAQREETLANADVKRQEATGKFLENLVRLLELPPGPQALAIAKLLHENPDLAEQLANVEQMAKTLNVLHGLSLCPADNPQTPSPLRIEENAASEES